jgi:hypothetical protein
VTVNQTFFERLVAGFAWAFAPSPPHRFQSRRHFFDPPAPHLILCARHDWRRTNNPINEPKRLCDATRISLAAMLPGFVINKG